MKAFRIFINWLFLIFIIIPIGGLIIIGRVIYEGVFNNESVERDMITGHEWFWKDIF